MSTERKRELAELRSRAYGPDPDIDRDEDALARLIELEELVRADVPELSREQDDAPNRLIRTPGDAASDDATYTAVVIDPTGSEAAPTPRSWWRRVPVGTYIVAAAAIGLVVGLAVPAVTAPRPLATLSPVPFVEGVELDFEMYGIPAESPVRYEPFHDLEVWSAMTQAGSRCVVVTASNGEWMTAACAPEPLSPTADINFFSGMRQIDGLELADGSVVRFILREDVMEVWIAETDEAA